jgi:phosphogluconate dehydratase
MIRGRLHAAIQTTPDAANGGLIGCIQYSGLGTIDAEACTFTVEADLDSRPPVVLKLSEHHLGMGEELFNPFRTQVGSAEARASVLR